MTNANRATAVRERGSQSTSNAPQSWKRYIARLLGEQAARDYYRQRIEPHANDGHPPAAGGTGRTVPTKLSSE